MDMMQLTISWLKAVRHYKPLHLDMKMNCCIFQIPFIEETSKDFVKFYNMEKLYIMTHISTLVYLRNACV